ncbi:EAL domain-containing protein [Sulfuricurvum sp.]|uniref:EAL domain-containing protein n=1 Tax=Sulfuricurvum sp. TaxID=2025608 RepID=UPI00261DDF3D|nr:EAL domain-containing protein [Sulfuricurvum sp.]MDD3597669.1 EAL domain-containing protein [Sulfuricurvum sp.]
MIGAWVLKTAIQQTKEWMDSGFSKMVIAVNLSAVQFRQVNLPDIVIDILDEIELPHECLELELTEAVTMYDPVAAISVMDTLHGAGIRMSIDDFGTGYSSLSYLKQFKIYKLKIDQSFIRDIATDPDDRSIVSAIIDMANSLGLRTIAEGVETTEQLAFLRLRGCNEIQGYYFSKPLPADQFQTLLEQHP